MTITLPLFVCCVVGFYTLGVVVGWVLGHGSGYADATVDMLEEKP